MISAVYPFFRQDPTGAQESTTEEVEVTPAAPVETNSVRSIISGANGLNEGSGLFSICKLTKNYLVCLFVFTEAAMCPWNMHTSMSCQRRTNVTIYLIKTIAMTQHPSSLFYINVTKEKTFCQTLNHSRKPANVEPKVFVVGPQQLDILFLNQTQS